MKLMIMSVLVLSAALLSSCSLMNMKFFDSFSLDGKLAEYADALPNEASDIQDAQNIQSIPDTNILSKKVSDESKREDTVISGDAAKEEETVNEEKSLDRYEEKAPEEQNIPANEEAEEQDVPANEEAVTVYENLITKMSDEKRMNVNLFLSNLSEASYNPASDYYGENEKMIAFAYSHAKVNWRKILVHDGNDVGLSAGNVDTILERFFGRTVPHETPKDSKHWTYRNGYFFVPAADGESYPFFTVVTNMTKRSDGNYDVDFNIYRDPEIGGGSIITDKSVYYLTDNQAAARYEYHAVGKAVLKDKVYNGSDSYEVVSYSVDYN